MQTLCINAFTGLNSTFYGDSEVSNSKYPRIVASFSHHLDGSDFYQVLNKAHSIVPSDSMNDRVKFLYYMRDHLSNIRGNLLHLRKMVAHHNKDKETLLLKEKQLIN